MSNYQIKPSGYETLKQLVELYGMEVILDALNRIQPGCTDAGISMVVTSAMTAALEALMAVEFQGDTSHESADGLVTIQVNWRQMAQAMSLAKAALTLTPAKIDEQIEQLEHDNATLRELLREVAPKCDECGHIATWWLNDDGYILYHCDCMVDSARIVGHPFDLGRRIKAALEEG